MGGKGRWVDHVFVEWLPALAASPGWPSVKYQDRYLLAYASVIEALVAQVSDFRVCNARRPHQALPKQTTDEMVLGTGEMNKAGQVQTRLAQRVA
jgi:putative transposase